MTELYLRAGLFVFAVLASLLAIWLGGAWVGSLIILAFILAFAGASKLTSIIDTLSKLSKMGPL
ncbi:fatty acid desaturase [Bradyrhizobium sp. OAE829]